MPLRAAFSPAHAPLQTSPSLSETPVVIASALSRAYPLIAAVDTVLGLITWQSEDSWHSVLMVLMWMIFVQYFKIVAVYMLPIGVASFVSAYSAWILSLTPPSLDIVVRRLDSAAYRWKVATSPVVSLNLDTRDAIRLITTSLLTSPISILVCYIFLTPQRVVLWGGVVFLSWHSLGFRVTRSVLWRLRVTRYVVFFFTGYDLESATTLPHGAKSDSKQAISTESLVPSNSDVRYTFTLYENQRRWLGIGWTANMLSYERTAWTDELLNDANEPDQFELPDSEGTGMAWRWVDPAWMLDLTNGGALPGDKRHLTDDPGPEEGFVYYDSVWKGPASEDGWFKYTRRRRWVRTAVLEPLNSSEDDSPKDQQHIDMPEGLRKRK